MVPVYVSRLRCALGTASGRLTTQRPGYRLRLDRTEIDADRCEVLLSEARVAIAAGQPELAEAQLREALGLWRGDPLHEFTFNGFADAEIRRLEEIRVSWRAELIEAQLDLGRHREVLQDVEAFVRDDPLHEGLHGQLMLALYRSGRQADALAAYQRARQLLLEKGIDPSPVLRELE